jgi:hypothetical protein
MFTPGVALRSAPLPGPEPMADVRWAAAKMTGATRRTFEAEMTLQYCGGNARQAERVCGWGRHTVALGLAERRTGILGVGAPSTCSGRPRWDDTQPPGAAALRQPAAAPAQQDPTLRTSLASTRLTATGALAGLRAQGSRDDHRPAPSTMAAVLPRLGLRRRTGVTAAPPKQRKETAASFANLKKRMLTPRQREGANAGAAMGQRRCPWGRFRAAV